MSISFPLASVKVSMVKLSSVSCAEANVVIGLAGIPSVRQTVVRTAAKTQHCPHLVSDNRFKILYLLFNQLLVN